MKDEWREEWHVGASRLNLCHLPEFGARENTRKTRSSITERR